MSKLLLDLRNVPDDEADEVRALLAANGIAFHEAVPSAWGLFAGGIWISDDATLPEARALFGEYQVQRQARARESYAIARREGRADTLWTTLRHEPGRAVVWLLTIALLLALTILPFLLLGR